MKLSEIITLVRRIMKTAPVRYDSGRGLLDEPEPLVNTTGLSAEQILELILAYYKAKQGYVTASDLVPVLKMAGKERAWLHNEIWNRVADYRLVYDDTRVRYEIML